MYDKKGVVLYIRITENCNARCFMCGFAKSKKPIYVQDQHMRDIVMEAKKSGIQLVRFTGGETLLHQGILAFIKSFKKENIKTSIITNGFLLPRFADALISASIDQIIVSIDGSKAALHDKLRDLNGLLENATKGIKAVKAKSNKVIVRVNTVVSPYNIDDLEDILNNLINLRVDQWSLIPLKSTKNLWESEDIIEVIKKYKKFQKKIKNITKPKLLGYSKQWAGRNDKEVYKYFEKGVVTMRPKNICNVVNLVRFYDPFSHRLLPCNCVPWRLENISVNTESGLSALNDKSLATFVAYVHENGPDICTGCEPTNAYLSDHPEILEKNIFLF